MSDITNTIRVKPWGKDQGDFVEINESDFNPDVHELYEEHSAPEEASADEIVAAIAALDAKDDAHWTKGGLPDVGALTKAIDKKVTRAAVDAAAPDAKRPEAE